MKKSISKTERKKAEATLAQTILDTLTSQDASAAPMIEKHVKKEAQSIMKKFRKAQKKIQKSTRKSAKKKGAATLHMNGVPLNKENSAKLEKEYNA